MPKESWKKFVARSEKIYFKIDSVVCPAFGNERVYFKSDGFRHLIRKNGVPRPTAEQKRKLRLITYAPIVLSSNKDFVTHRQSLKKGHAESFADFWTFKHIVSEKIIVVIVRQLGNGPKHFFSIMDKKLPKSEQTL